MHLIITPGSVRQPVRAPVRRTVETELRHLPTSELETLQRSLRRQLAELPVGSPASRLIGRLCRIANGAGRALRPRRVLARAGRHAEEPVPCPGGRLLFVREGGDTHVSEVLRAA